MRMGVRQRTLAAIDISPEKCPPSSPKILSGRKRPPSRSPRTSPNQDHSVYPHTTIYLRRLIWCLLLVIFASIIIASFVVLNYSFPNIWTHDEPIHHSLLRQISIQQNSEEEAKYNFDFQPRVFYMEGKWNTGIWSRHRKKKRVLDVEESNLNTVQDDWQQPHEHCLPKADWQVQSYPNCNNIHEINLVTATVDDHHIKREDVLTPLGEGWFRTTWKLDRTLNHNHEHESVVLKTLRIQREYLSEYYELHRRDAVAMERLTASPFVVNVYGYCGQSAINELADFPFNGIQNLEAFNRRMRNNKEGSTKSNIIKLRMAASIALGLADIHAGGTTDPDDENVYITHYDLNPRNIALFQGGKPKINDFNIAEFLRYDPETNETCKFPSRLHEPWWRAPEEMNTTHTIMVNEKVDVYALGNILYHTLTSHSGRGKQKKDRMDEVRPMVAAGISPEIPHTYTKSKDPNVIAMIKAIELCWEKDPEKRASSEEVAAVLYEALLHVHESSHSNTDVDPNELNNKHAATSDEDEDDDDSASDEVEDKDVLGHKAAQPAK